MLRVHSQQMFDTVAEDVLSEFYPLNLLFPKDLILLADKTPIVCAKKSRVIIEEGDSDKQAIYLLRGKLELTPSDGHSYIVEAGTVPARKPISHLDPHKYTVKCLSYVEFFRIENNVIDNLLEGEAISGTEVKDLNFSDAALNSRLFKDIYEDLQNDNLEIPTLPKIAVEVQRAINDDTNIRDLELMIQSDVVLAAVLLKIANSPIYRSRKAVVTIEQAILRLGLQMVKNIIINYAMRNFYKSKIPHIHQLMKYAWVHSAEVAALSYVLSAELGLFDPEQALLMGLLHDIGMIPILVYAERYPDLLDNLDNLDQILWELHGEVGAAILAQWQFPNDFVVVARESDDWYRDPATTPDYCDLVLVAQLHSFIGQKPDKIKALVNNSQAPVEQVPAFKKLGLGAFSPNHGLTILANANKYLTTVKKLLDIDKH